MDETHHNQTGKQEQKSTAQLKNKNGREGENVSEKYDPDWKSKNGAN